MPAPGPDVKPELKGPQFLAWLFFFVSYITGMASPGLAGMTCLVIGIIRKGGIPKFNTAYL